MYICSLSAQALAPQGRSSPDALTLLSRQRREGSLLLPPPLLLPLTTPHHSIQPQTMCWVFSLPATLPPAGQSLGCSSSSGSRGTSSADSNPSKNIIPGWVRLLPLDVDQTLRRVGVNSCCSGSTVGYEHTRCRAASVSSQMSCPCFPLFSHPPPPESEGDDLKVFGDRRARLCLPLLFSFATTAQLITGCLSPETAEVVGSTSPPPSLSVRPFLPQVHTYRRSTQSHPLPPVCCRRLLPPSLPPEGSLTNKGKRPCFWLGCCTQAAPPYTPPPHTPPPVPSHPLPFLFSASNTFSIFCI